MRIFDFALIANWEDRLEELSQLAEPERWTYLTAPSELKQPILDSYVRYTFIRLYEQNRIEESGNLACFNTGLLTPSQEEIFGLFDVADKYEPNAAIGPRNKKWFLKTWARAGDHVLTGFTQLPTMATYWVNPGELILDPSLKVELNLDHIIRDNLNRFPEELGGKLNARGVPTDIDSSSEDDDDAPIVDVRPVKIPLALRSKAR